MENIGPNWEELIASLEQNWADNDLVSLTHEVVKSIDSYVGLPEPLPGIRIDHRPVSLNLFDDGLRKFLALPDIKCASFREYSSAQNVWQRYIDIRNEDGSSTSYVISEREPFKQTPSHLGKPEVLSRADFRTASTVLEKMIFAVDYARGLNWRTTTNRNLDSGEQPGGWMIIRPRTPLGPRGGIPAAVDLVR